MKLRKVQNSPSRWIPGKLAAHRFVRDTGFPDELAGLASQERPPDFARLEGRVDLRELEGYQIELKGRIIDELGTGGGRAIATLPTGAGKTRVAVEAIRDWLTERHRIRERKASTVIWLAHASELCEQAYTAFEQVWQSSVSVCPLLLFRFWGDFTADMTAHARTLGDILSQPSVLISTPQRIESLINDPGTDERNVLDNVMSSIGAIVIDEAHRAAAPSYLRIMNHFLKTSPELPIIGLTATPVRNAFFEGNDDGTKDLKRVFERLIEASSLAPDPRSKLQEMGVLARPVWETITIQHPRYNSPIVGSTDRLTGEEMDKTDVRLKRRVQKHERRQKLLERMLPICRVEGNSVLYFGPSVIDAEVMACLLREADVSAVAVSGNTRSVTRRQLISDFKEGRTRVLCNCEVLTTGFDSPRVTHVIMARPTISRVLYEQMVGRGLRGPKFGGTAECLIIDCEDNYRNGRPRMGYEDFRDIWKPEPSSPRNRG